MHWHLCPHHNDLRKQKHHTQNTRAKTHCFLAQGFTFPEAAQRHAQVCFLVAQPRFWVRIALFLPSLEKHSLEKLSSEEERRDVR